MQFSTGIGLRQPHYRDFIESDLQALAPVDFLEVHSENFFSAGGAARSVLAQVRQRFPLSLHGVGLGLGNAHGLHIEHLQALKKLIDWIEPALVSEHVCWTASEDIVLNDLLPLPHTKQALKLLCSHIDQTQTLLKRQILIENATAYVRFKSDEMSEAEFVAQAALQTGCGILLDVNNLYINSVHFEFDPFAALLHFPRGSVKQIHLAGHLATGDGLIDDHGSRVAPAVWRLYQAALTHFGPVPTLIEWDTNIPPLAVLLKEAHMAHEMLEAREKTPKQEDEVSEQWI